MEILGWRGLVVSVVTLAVVAGGCAKRPATTQASAPAPTGAAGTTGAVDSAARMGTSGAGSGAAGQGTGAGASGSMQPGSGTGAGGSATGTGAGARAGAGTEGTGAGAGAGSGASTTPGSAGARPSPREFTAVPELKDVFFDFDRYDIRPSDAQVLDANAAWLKQNASQLLLIEGHCDERGTNEYNLALGERRAKAAMNYLVAQGVQANRITIISYGEERPACREKSEACWAQNRRAHFLVKPR
jgi:peptidoglycan-associated lipoprotein